MHRVEFVRFKTLIYVAIYSFPPFNFQQLGEKLWIFLRNDCKTRPSSQQSDVNESIFNRVWHFFCVCVCVCFLDRATQILLTKTTSPSGNAANHWVSGMIQTAQVYGWDIQNLEPTKRGQFLKRQKKNIHDDWSSMDLIFAGVFMGIFYIIYRYTKMCQGLNF